MLCKLSHCKSTRWNVPEPVQPYGFTPQELQNGELSAFWEEILETQAVAITDEVL